MSVLPKWRILCIPLVLLLIGASLAASQQAPESMSISFHRPIQDDELISLFEATHAQPRVFYFVAGDLFGSQRVNSSKDASTAVQHLRQAILAMQKKSSQSLRRRLQTMVSTYSTQGFEKDEAAQRDAEYYLHRLSIAEDIQRAALAGEPFVYAVEATVPHTSSARLAADPLVSRAISSTLLSTKNGAEKVIERPPQPEVPAHFQFYPSPSLDPIKLYEQIKDILISQGS